MTANGQAIEVAATRATDMQVATQRSAPEIVGMTRLVQEVMQSVMTEGVHYGKIPGCGDKPALFKAGAEKLALTFRLALEPTVEYIDLGGGHREVRVTTRVTHIPTGDVWGSGVGSCSTMEAKYRWRGGSRKCPECGKESIIKGKKEYGGGYLCFAKKGGCGAKWPDGAKEIEEQPLDRVENQDVADTYNTVLKMADKRSYVCAILKTTATSDSYTQDIEELSQREDAMTPPESPNQATIEPTPSPQSERQRLFDSVKKWTGIDPKTAAADFGNVCRDIAAVVFAGQEEPAGDAKYKAMYGWVTRQHGSGIDFIAALKPKKPAPPTVGDDEETVADVSAKSSQPKPGDGPLPDRPRWSVPVGVKFGMGHPLYWRNEWMKGAKAFLDREPQIAAVKGNTPDTLACQMEELRNMPLPGTDEKAAAAAYKAEAIASREESYNWTEFCIPF